jgi:hypothetical protein
MDSTRLLRRAAAGLIAAALLGVTLAVMAPLASAAPRDRTPPTTPTGLHVTGKTPHSVSLAWNPSTDNRGEFRLRYIVVDSRGWSTLVWHPKTTVTITWLTPGSTYSFHVYAEDASWNRSGNSNTVTESVPFDTTPPTAPVLSVTRVTPSQVSLAWTASVDEIPFGTGYRLLLDGALAPNVMWGYLQATVRHLAPGTTHSFTVEASDQAGNVAASNTETVTTEISDDTTPPTAPTNLRHTDLNWDCEVTLAWDQSTDNDDPQSAIEYEIYLNGVFADLTAGTGSILTYGFRGSEPSTFALFAVDRSGNVSASSNTITLTPMGC